MARRKTKPWVTFRMGGSLWSVFLVPTDNAKLDGAEGILYHADSAIYIDESLEGSRLVAVLMHEIVHAAFSNANEELLSSVFGVAPARLEATEERLASLLGPAFADALTSANILRLPKT